MAKTAVLFLNLGGPNSIKDVKPFLYNLFSDPDILVGMPAPMRKILAFIIAQTKGRLSEKSYEAIGGKSPQLHWTTCQAKGLERLLNIDPAHRYIVGVGMRAWNPTIEEALAELKKQDSVDDSITELVLYPLFPHFSTTTTGSCFKEADRILKKMQWSVPVRKITRWPDQLDYIALLRKTLDETLAVTPKPYHLILSAHSLPMKIVERGDRYQEDVARTIQALTKNLPKDINSSLAFQSRNGKMKWIEPYLDQEIIRLANLGVKNLVICPISFVSDHIETLYELDMEYGHMAKKAGIESYLRTRSFNDDSEFLKVLKNVFYAS